MARFLSIFAFALVVLAAGVALVWYLAAGLAPTPPGRVALAGLEGPVEIGWQEDGVVTIATASEHDAAAAMGFAQAAEQAWTMALLRQTALGELSGWFGDGLIEVDAFTRRLGLAATAQAAFATLPPEEQALLAAYAEGVNAALTHSQAAQADPFVLLRVEPAPWQAWHSLAVERLYTWLAAPPLDTTTARPDTALAAFFAGDARLRDWLHLHGFAHGAAWTARDSGGVALYTRYVYGDTALPLFQEVVIQGADTTAIVGAALLGTPFLPVGRTARRAWSVLLAGSARLERAVLDTAAVAARFERLTARDGTERLVRARRTDDGLWFDPPPRRAAPLRFDTLQALRAAPDSLADVTRSGPSRTLLDSLRRATAPLPDTTWVVRWAGFAPVSDMGAWRALLRGTAEPSFRLIRGDGLRLSREGSVAVLGDPPVQRAYAQGLVVGYAPTTAYLALRLDTLTWRGGPVQPAAWADDAFSPWAATLAPSLIDSVALERVQSEVLREALTYLRNWDYVYDRASIGASIFEGWVRAYQDSVGFRPDDPAADSLYFEKLLRQRALETAVRTLVRRHGLPLSRWRWEEAYAAYRFFPVWSADSLVTGLPGTVARTRYAPLPVPTRGHPTALAWGASPLFGTRPATASWEAWLYTGAWDQLFARRLYLRPDAFLSRHLLPDRAPDPVPLQAMPTPARRTTLVPRAGA